MKAFAIQNSFGLESLLPMEVPTPQPGPGQVLVKIEAASLNYRDYMTVIGSYNPRLALPQIPLSDGAGEVTAVGEGAQTVKVGDRVTGTFFQDWEGGEYRKQVVASSLGGPLPGTLAEYALFRERGVVPIPAHLSYEEAATLPCAAVTAWNALVIMGGVKAGDTVLLQGTGGVSIFALQFAKLSGARPIITSSSDEKLERARALGASEGINYRTTPEWDKRVLELTDGLGVDHIVEVGGAETLPLSLNAARPHGKINIIGALSGAAKELTVRHILVKYLRVQGIFVGSRAVFESMNRAVSLHQLRPVIDRVFPFEEAPEAVAYMKSAAHFGKIVIRIGSGT